MSQSIEQFLEYQGVVSAGAVARFAPASSGFAAVPNGVLVAAAAGIRFDAIRIKRFRIARYCAMLSIYAVAGACGMTGFAGICVKQRVLKARNV